MKKTDNYFTNKPSMRNTEQIRTEYGNWIHRVADDEIQEELRSMDAATIEDAFYRDLAFGTGGLRGTIGAGTNRMNKYVVAKASQGLAKYLKTGAVTRADKPTEDKIRNDKTERAAGSLSVVIGYDSRIKSDLFATIAAGIFADNGMILMDKEELVEAIIEALERHEKGDSKHVLFWQITEAVFKTVLVLCLAYFVGNITINDRCTFFDSFEELKKFNIFLSEGFGGAKYAIDEIQRIQNVMIPIYAFALIGLVILIITSFHHSKKEAQDRIGLIFGIGSIGAFILMMLGKGNGM